MKLLVVIKGQLRTWEHNYKHLRRFVEDAVYKLNSSSQFEGSFRADVLLSCWDLSYQIYPDSFSIDYLTKDKTSFAEEIAFFKNSPLIDAFHVNQVNYAEAFNLFSDLKFELPEDYHFPCYLAYRTGLAKREIERTQQERYDLILEIRPDVYYPKREPDFPMAERPFFGEILGFEGTIMHFIDGVASASINDLIFLMTAETYDIFSREINFHYTNFKNSLGFTSVHFEKCIFLNSKHFVVRSLGPSLCNMPVIFRPLINHAESFERVETEKQLLALLRHVDKEWLQTKEINLQKIMAEHGESLGIFLANKRAENDEKLKYLLNY